MSRTLRIGPFVALLLVLIVIGGCPYHGLVYEEDLVAGYAVWATDVIEDAAIIHRDAHSGGIQVVPPMVIAYGWNDDFIIAKQQPADYGKIMGNAIHWYIIQVQNRKVHGPLGEGEFEKRRTELLVPSDLSFTKEIPRGKSGAKH